MIFCEICGLYSNVSSNMNKNVNYICKGHSKPMCKKCGLYLNSKNKNYMCVCKTTKTKKSKKLDKIS